MIPVKNEPHLFRDSNGTIQNMDDDAYQVYIRSRQLIEEKNSKIESLELRLSRLENLLNNVLERKSE